MIGRRVRIKPKTRDATEQFRLHMKRDQYMYVTDRKDRWLLYNPNSGIQIWVHPTDDPEWEIL